MSLIAFVNTISRFLRDRSGRLATVSLGQDHAWKKQRDEEERQESRLASLLLVGLAAAIYVSVRIGLTYGVVGLL